MAPFRELSDNFSDNSIARAWTALVLGSGAVSEASGRATCTLPGSTAGTHQAYYRSAHTYDLTGDAAAININGMVNTGVAATMTFDVYADPSNIYRWRQLSGTLTARAIVGGVDTQLYSVTWNATTHKWLRIRESGGTVYFDTSTNGSSWTNRATQTVAGAFGVTALTVQFGAQGGNLASPGSLTVEDFNPLSLSTTWRWIEGSRPYQHRIGSASIAATGGVGYLAIAASIDASGNLVSPVYYSGPLADGRELTLQASQADAEAMAPRLPTNGRWHVPPSAFVEGRYCRLYIRSHDGASFTVREYYPRRFIQADDIEAESIRALHIAAGSITADRLSVLQLSAITADMGTLTAGTITGATIQTATSGARVVLDSANGVRSFNSGGTLQTQIRTSDGALLWGAGANLLNADGMQVGVGGAAGTAPAIRWMSGGSELHRIHGDSSGLWMQSQTTKLGISPSDYSYITNGLVVGADRSAGGARKGELDVFGEIYVEGGVHIADSAYGGALPAPGYLAVEGGVSTGTGIEVGALGTGSRSAWVDLVGDTTYTDYGARFIRDSGGANTDTLLSHRGTGTLYVQAIDAGSVAIGTSGNVRAMVASDGKASVGMGLNVGASTQFVVRGATTGSANNAIAAQASSGTTIMYIRDDGADNRIWSAWALISDEREKDAIADIPAGALDRVRRWRPRSYTLRLADDPRRHYGFIAQELDEPDLVELRDMGGDRGARYGLRQEEMLPILVAAVQELAAQVVALTAGPAAPSVA